MSTPLTYAHALHLLFTLEELTQAKAALPTNFAVSASLNKTRLKAIKDAATEALKGEWDETIEAFERDRLDTLTAYAERDEKTGTPVMDGDSIRLRDPAEWPALFQALRDRHPGLNDAIVARNSRAVEIDAKELPADLTLETVGRADLPAQLSIEQADRLMPMVR